MLSNLPPVNAGAPPAASNNDEALLLIRDYSDKYDAKLDDQINDKMSAFLRFSQRKDLQYFAPDLTGPSGGDGNGYIHTHRSERFDRLHLGRHVRLRCSKRASDSRTFWPAKSRPTSAAPAWQSLFGGFAGLPTCPNLTGGLNTQTISGFATSLGRQTSNPQFQNPTSFDPEAEFLESRSAGIR